VFDRIGVCLCASSNRQARLWLEQLATNSTGSCTHLKTRTNPQTPRPPPNTPSPLKKDFTIFIPTIAKVAARHRLSHERFERLAERLLGAEPPCMSDAEDWEGAGGWAPEIDALAEQAALQVGGRAAGRARRRGRGGGGAGFGPFTRCRHLACRPFGVVGFMCLRAVLVAGQGGGQPGQRRGGFVPCGPG
jgi:hypothetical protein